MHDVVVSMFGLYNKASTGESNYAFAAFESETWDDPVALRQDVRATAALVTCAKKSLPDLVFFSHVDVKVLPSSYPRWGLLVFYFIKITLVLCHVMDNAFSLRNSNGPALPLTSKQNKKIDWWPDFFHTHVFYSVFSHFCFTRLRSVLHRIYLCFTLRFATRISLSLSLSAGPVHIYGGVPNTQSSSPHRKIPLKHTRRGSMLCARPFTKWRGLWVSAPLSAATNQW